MGSIIRILFPKYKDERFLRKVEFNEDGYYVQSTSQNANYKISVIMPVYNAEKTLTKTIDSVIKQTMGFSNIEFIILDDNSTDKSKLIILEYARKYSNIVAVFFKKNNGSPAVPRNVGIDIAKGKYVTFIDSDDWLAPKGLEILYHLLEKTGNPYAIGRTIKEENNKYSITGEYNSCENRDLIAPRSIPHIFQHLGPTARMMRTQFLREYQCRFPNMKYAEDKQFFIDVLIHCPAISTSKEIVYYVNRNSDNKSLVSRTSIFEKTDTNIAVIKYVINKNLPEELERMILNRLYEFDCITRLFNRHHFLNSLRKDKYFKKFEEVLKTTEDLCYDFTENFFHPWHKVLVGLFQEGRYDDIVQLIQWSLKENTKETLIINNLPYYKLPFEEPYHIARIDLLAVFHSFQRGSDSCKLFFSVYGEKDNQLHTLVIRDRTNHLNEKEFPIQKVSERMYATTIHYEQLKSLTPSSYQMFVKYNRYRKLMLKMNTRNIVFYGKNEFDFYTTKNDNYGLTIK